MERPSKRTKLLSDEDSDSDQSDTPHNELSTSSLRVNRDYARRFEHNKEREERERLEEKYKDDEEDEEDSSSDETEDDDAELVTADLDDEIMSTLAAIKNKDPRVYDQNNKFYQEFDPETGEAIKRSKETRDRPMTLKDYHRENLMAGYTGAEPDQSLPKRTPFQEQEDLRQQVTSQMHAMADNGDGSDDEFVVKAKGAHENIATVKSKKITNADVAAADQDPETFLSNFMASQGWRSSTGVNAQPFDSDDSEDEDRADAFEAAYNLRFEDPATANETLKTFARDNGQYSVRRDKTGGRKLAREKERQVKDHAKRERNEDRARLRKLRIEEAEKKLKAIKHAAGIRGEEADIEQWRDIIDGDFDDAAWDKEMEKRFGTEYYAKHENQHIAGSVEGKRKAKKPKWDDDIDIDDLVPGFEEEENGRPKFELTDDEDVSEPVQRADAEHVEFGQSKPKSKKDREKAKQEAKAQSRRERRAIEDIVDASLPVAAAQTSGFRYRDTSPTSFGMSSRDILFATDAQLNEFAGLKKLAAFRDENRKAKDRQKLGKKARLREWRKEVFGNADGFVETAVIAEDDALAAPGKKQRSKKRKRGDKNSKNMDAL